MSCLWRQLMTWVCLAVLVAQLSSMLCKCLLRFMRMLAAVWVSQNSRRTLARVRDRNALTLVCLNDRCQYPSFGCLKQRQRKRSMSGLNGEQPSVALPLKYVEPRPLVVSARQLLWSLPNIDLPGSIDCAQNKPQGLKSPLHRAARVYFHCTLINEQRQAAVLQ
jgi:hypothetical protein